MSSNDYPKKETDVLLPKKEKIEDVTFFEDCIDTVKLGIPIFVSMISWVGMKTTDTALLGHVSAEALEASALSDLWTMCTAVFLNGGVLGILIGGAVGADNPKLAGIYLQVSYFVIAIIAVFVFLAWNITEYVWVALGADPLVSADAGYYARMLSVSIPATVAYAQISRFFSAQRIMNPEVLISSVALFANLVLGLIFVLGIPIPGFNGFGFEACPIVTSSIVYIQMLVMYVVFIKIQKLHEPCWGGWSYSEITYNRIRTFCELFIPAALSLASDFWRVSVIGVIAANIGTVEVAVFNTAYRVMWMTLILVNSLAVAAGIKMNVRFGKMDHLGAKQAGYAGLAMGFVLLLIISFIAMYNVRILGSIFTNDPDFLDAFEDAKIPFTFTLFFMNLAVAIEKIPYSMGRTTEVFWMGVVASWGGQVPAAYLLTKYWRNDLVGLYWGIAIGYLILTILYAWIAFTSDWEKYARIARDRAEMAPSSTSRKAMISDEKRTADV